MRGNTCFPISSCQSCGGAREGEVQPVSVAESKIPCVSRQVFEVLLPLAQPVLVPSSAQHQWGAGLCWQEEILLARESL